MYEGTLDKVCNVTGYNEKWPLIGGLCITLISVVMTNLSSSNFIDNVFYNCV